MSSVSRRERLAALQPTGEVFVNGLASSYDDEFPDSPRLATVMTREDFAKAMATINDALLDHWPCLPCKGFGYGCCICTLGLSLYCAATQVQEAESRLQLQLRRMNEQKKFKDKGVQWRLERTWWKRTSFIEISVDSEVAVTEDESSEAVVADKVEVDGAVRDETMSDRVV
ncbi:Golgin subfamily A member 7/ERF4 [Phytophthora cinnamomi]|uniref:Golgin subfamily A member 7/ERF4 n=1 Tax=Phytophthora cinnamomi TaxID=4785 RepID=UPI003559A37D|nr:Golgin subfamily A member 7/ERF4 [Phytophthora cinnamomi]